MPATILTTLLLWSSLLLPGVTNGQARDLASSPASRRSMSPVPVEQLTIQALPIDASAPWTLSEATSEEEEESTDGDDHAIIVEWCWDLARTGQQGPASMIRLDRGFACSPDRSTILRC